MRLQIDEIPSLKETEIIIRCREVDSKINKIANFIRTSYITIQGKLDGEKYVINLDDIYYFESVENRVFALALVIDIHLVGSCAHLKQSRTWLKVPQHDIALFRVQNPCQQIKSVGAFYKMSSVEERFFTVRDDFVFYVEP